MHLTLVIPGLLWPRQALRDTVCDLSLPALERLLGGIRSRNTLPVGTNGYWRSRFGAPLPAAPLRRLALNKDASGDWLCADPVHMRLSPQGVSVDDPTDLALEWEEARNLHADLAPLCGELGELVCDEPGRWHLRPAVALPRLPDELPLGLSAAELIPSGPGAREWARLFNAWQMVLHTHPVNASRTARGLPPVNSLVLWGCGTLPLRYEAPWPFLFSNDPILRGAALHSGATTTPLPEALDTLNPVTRCCVHIDHFISPLRQKNAMAWRDALQALECDWIRPALQQNIPVLELVASDDEQTHVLTWHRMDRWQFWRRPQPLTALVP
ncbi:MAG: hypothetical protein JSR19_11400 [Proteobacteria bacterium]|nr:hypothetical protein [Pseudomonadota bacterium]HQR02647.1 hypothetical protein [Rhodocyclaceae bacterium]